MHDSPLGFTGAAKKVVRQAQKPGPSPQIYQQSEESCQQKALRWPRVLGPKLPSLPNIVVDPNTLPHDITMGFHFKT